MIHKVINEAINKVIKQPLAGDQKGEGSVGSGVWKVNPHAGAGTTINISLHITSLQSSFRAADRYLPSRPGALLAHTCCPARWKCICACKLV